MLIPYLSGTYRTVIKADSLRKKTESYREERSYFRDNRDSHSFTLEYRNGRPWFFNDHCFYEDGDGKVHLFGINNPYPAKGGILYEFHPFLSHFMTDDPVKGDWMPIGFALNESAGNEYLGAPYVFQYKKDRSYRMLFESRIGGRRSMEMAVSSDLMHWERMGESLFDELGYTKRDPCVIFHGGSYRIYLCNPQKGKSLITMAETEDFRSFRYTDVLEIPDGSDYGGIESPYVLDYNGFFYLFFTYAHRHYYETVVIPSKRHDAFRMEDSLTTLFGHASEILRYKGKTYMSSSGPEDYQELNDHGIKLIELLWAEVS